MVSKDKHKHSIEKNKNFIMSFRHAIDGLVEIFITERNFRFHLTVAILVILFSFLMKLSVTDWLWILLAIFSVLIAEIVNTLCESIVDLVVGNHYYPLARRIKDIAAGGVVIAALFAIIVGLIIYLPILLKIL